MISRSPLLLIILNFLVGYLVSQGYVDPGNQDQFVNALADTIGLGIVFITSIFSLHHIAQNRKHDQKQSPVKVLPGSEQKSIPPQEIPIDPSSTSVQETSSKDVPLG